MIFLGVGSLSYKMTHAATIKVKKVIKGYEINEIA